jgi:CRP/FNR family transcriptional regulator
VYIQSSFTGKTVVADPNVVAIGPSTLAGIFIGQTVEYFDTGKALIWQGEEASHVFEIVSGALRTVRMLSDGRRVITGFLFAGDLIGVSTKGHYSLTVEAIAPTSVRRLARRRFEESIERFPHLRPRLIERLCDEMAAAQQQVVLLARKTAEERVASFLLLLARREDEPVGPGRTIGVPMTRLDMADYLGLTIETVSRVMTRLTARGIITSVGRRQVAIRRPAALAALAADDEGDEGDERGIAWVP